MLVSKDVIKLFKKNPDEYGNSDWYRNGTGNWIAVVYCSIMISKVKYTCKQDFGLTKIPFMGRLWGGYRILGIKNEQELLRSRDMGILTHLATYMSRRRYLRTGDTRGSGWYCSAGNTSAWEGCHCNKRGVSKWVSKVCAVLPIAGLRFPAKKALYLGR